MKNWRRSRTFQRAAPTVVRGDQSTYPIADHVLDQLAHAVGGHLNIAQIMRPAGGRHRGCGAAHNFLALCLSARLIAPFQGDGELFG